MVVWADCTTQQSHCIVSHLLPDFAVKVPDYNLSGRSGNHVGCGWFVAQRGELGDGLSNSRQINNCSIRDLVPAIFDTMGATPLAHFEGRASLWQGCFGELKSDK